MPSAEQCPTANNSAEIMHTLKLDICRLKEDVEDALAGLILSVDGLSCSLTVKVDPTFGPYSDRTISMVVPRPLDAVVPVLECISSKPTTISYVDVKYNVQVTSDLIADLENIANFHVASLHDSCNLRLRLAGSRSATRLSWTRQEVPLNWLVSATSSDSRRTTARRCCSRRGSHTRLGSNFSSVGGWSLTGCHRILRNRSSTPATACQTLARPTMTTRRWDPCATWCKRSWEKGCGQRWRTFIATCSISWGQDTWTGSCRRAAWRAHKRE